MYDYVIVGVGYMGLFCDEVIKIGNKCLVVDMESGLVVIVTGNKLRGISIIGNTMLYFIKLKVWD